MEITLFARTRDFRSCLISDFFNNIDVKRTVRIAVFTASTTSCPERVPRHKRFHTLRLCVNGKKILRGSGEAGREKIAFISIDDYMGVDCSGDDLHG